jgi:hypothetical protein
VLLRWDKCREVAMTDREKLLIALLSEDDTECDGHVTVLEVAAMLFELGEEYRRLAYAGVAPARV